MGKTTGPLIALYQAVDSAAAISGGSFSLWNPLYIPSTWRMKSGFPEKMPVNDDSEPIRTAFLNGVSTSY